MQRELGRPQSTLPSAGRHENVVSAQALPTIFATGCQNNHIPSSDFILHSIFLNAKNFMGMEFPFFCRAPCLPARLMTPGALKISAGGVVPMDETTKPAEKAGFVVWKDMITSKCPWRGRRPRR